MNNGFFWVGHCQKVESNSVVDQLASRSRRKQQGKAAAVIHVSHKRALIYSGVAAAAAAASLQSCPTLCDLIDGSPPGSPVPGILQARTLEWVAISFSNAGK